MAKSPHKNPNQSTLDLTRGISRRIYSGARMGRRINRVSIGAEFLFWRLHMVADDFGNFLADPALIRSEAFPRRDIPLSDIEGWLRELTDVDLIRSYEADGDSFGHIVDFLLLQPCGRNGRRVRRFAASPHEVEELESCASDEPSDDCESGLVRVNPGESGCIQTSPGESGGIRGKPEKSGGVASKPCAPINKPINKKEEEEKQQPEKTHGNRTEKGAAAGAARRGDRENKSDAVATPLDQAFARVGINRKTWPRLAALPGITPKLVDRCHTAWRGRRGKGIGALVGDIEAACAQAAAKPAASAPKYHVAETRTEPPLSPEVKRQIAEQARRDAEQERRHNRAPPHPVAAPSSSSLQLVSA